MGETFSERKKGGTLFEKTSLFQKNIRIKQYNLEIRKKGAEVDVALLRGVVRDSVFGVHDISQVIFKRIPVVIEYPNTDMRKFYLSSVADGVRKDVTSVFENLPISLWSTADTVFERDDVIAFNTGTSIPEKPQIIVLQIRDILGRIDGVNYYMRYAAHPCTMYLGGDVVRTLVERLGLDVVVEVVKVKDIDIDIEKSGVWSAKNQRLREEKNKEDLKRLEKNSPIVFG